MCTSSHYPYIVSIISPLINTTKLLLCMHSPSLFSQAVHISFPGHRLYVSGQNSTNQGCCFLSSSCAYSFAGTEVVLHWTQIWSILTYLGGRATWWGVTRVWLYFPEGKKYHARLQYIVILLYQTVSTDCCRYTNNDVSYKYCDIPMQLLLQLYIQYVGQVHTSSSPMVSYCDRHTTGSSYAATSRRLGKS